MDDYAQALDGYAVALDDYAQALDGYAVALDHHACALDRKCFMEKKVENLKIEQVKLQTFAKFLCRMLR